MMLIFPHTIAASRMPAIKQRFQLAQGFGARKTRLGHPGLAASGHIQHPERYLQNPKGLSLLQAAVRHCPAALYERGMYPHLTAMPRMPWIADFPQILDMGVVLRSCTSKTVFTTPWKRTRRMEGRLSRSQPWVPPSIPCRDWADCTIATAGARRRNRHFDLDGSCVRCRLADVVRLLLLSATRRPIATSTRTDFRRVSLV